MVKRLFIIVFMMSVALCLVAESLEDKLKSFGWYVLKCDGHDFKELCSAFSGICDRLYSHLGGYGRQAAL